MKVPSESYSGTVIVPVIVPSASAAPPVAGKWQVYTNVGGTENDGTCTFVQTSTVLTGTCDPAAIRKGSGTRFIGLVFGAAGDEVPLFQGRGRNRGGTVTPPRACRRRS